MTTTSEKEKKGYQEPKKIAIKTSATKVIDADSADVKNEK